MRDLIHFGSASRGHQRIVCDYMDFRLRSVVRHLHEVQSAVWDFTRYPASQHEIEAQLATIPRHVHTLRIASWWVTDLSTVPSPASLEIIQLARTSIVKLPLLPRGVRMVQLHNCRRLAAHATRGRDRWSRQSRSLDLSGCTSIRPMFLWHLPSFLSFVTLNRTHVTATHLRGLPRKLEELNLADCPQLIREALAALPTSIDYLNLSRCLQLTGYDLEALPRRIKFVDFIGCTQLTADDIASLAKRRRSIVRLIFHGCTQLTGDHLTRIPHSVASIWLTGCHQLTDAHLAMLPVTVVEVWTWDRRFLRQDELNHLRRQA